MFVYIDMLVKGVERPLDGNRPLPETGGANKSQTYKIDDDGIRDTPPYLLSPAMVVLARSDGEVEIFDSPDTGKLLYDMAKYLETPPLTGNETLVGWCLDQTVIPVLAANAMMYGVDIPNRLLRKMDDKWAKVAGHSVERAFLQGWFPDSRERSESAYKPLTLNSACTLTGIDMSETYKALGGNIPEDARMLMTRVSAISTLYTRYQDIINREAACRAGRTG